MLHIVGQVYQTTVLAFVVFSVLEGRREGISILNPSHKVMITGSRSDGKTEDKAINYA